MKINIKKMISDYQNGLTILSLMNKYHISQNRVYYILNLNHIKIRNNSEIALMKYKERLKKISLQITGKYNLGKSINQICLEFKGGISREMISRILVDNKVKLRGFNLSGKMNANWKGGKIKLRNGYIVINSPNHPMKNSQGYVLEHRLIMEKHIKRYLKNTEIVHHIDGNPSNNDIKNLVITNIHEHTAGHNSKRIWKKESKLKSRENALMRDRNDFGEFIK